MRAILHQSLFETSGANDLDLLSLIRLCDRNEHHIALTKPWFDPADSHHPVVKWMERMPLGLRREIQEVLERAQRRSISASRNILSADVRAQAKSDWARRVLCLKDAVELFARPLRLLLENEINDYKFLLCLVPSIHRDTLIQAKKRNWIDARHGGGLPQMKAFIEELATSPDEHAPLELLRCWVLFDRDVDPNDHTKPSLESNELLQRCEGAYPCIPCVQLPRRSIENFLPPRALAAWAVRMDQREDAHGTDTLRAFFSAVRREPQVYWYYSVKEGLLKGLGKERRKRFEAGERLRRDELDTVFQSMSEDEIQSLAKGFGKNVAVLFSESIPSFTEVEFQTEYDRGPEGQPPRDEIINSLLNRI